jgi:hypothetical protein
MQRLRLSHLYDGPKHQTGFAGLLDYLNRIHLVSVLTAVSNQVLPAVAGSDLDPLATTAPSRDNLNYE